MYRGHWGGSTAPSPASPREIATTGAAARNLWSAIAPGEAAAARSFYQDVLRGRQVWPTEDESSSLWFLVGGTLLEVSPEPRGGATAIALNVNDPEEVATRAWDAGFTVRVRENATSGAPISIIDPLGRRIDLAAASNHPRARAS
jgi:hypothetical protein